jgi:hypothetical protein
VKKARRDSGNRKSWGQLYFDIGKSETPMRDMTAVI